jgi:prolyl-tRNA editing enzyme YbaK/EbsC (Cys-tRNA(Pro) deacylase)
LGHRTEVPIFIDATLGRFDVVYAAAGSAQTIFPIVYNKLVEITRGQVMDVVRED